MIKRFYSCLVRLLKGYDVGLYPNPFLMGELPTPKNREQRRLEEKKNSKYWNSTDK